MKLPGTILLSDPRRERRGRCSTAALTMAVTDPVGTPNELKYASSAEASTSDGMLYLAAHDYESSAPIIDAKAIHRVGRQSASVAGGRYGGLDFSARRLMARASPSMPVTSQPIVPPPPRRDGLTPSNGAVANFATNALVPLAA
jgi:hypothetical protein